MSGITIAGRKIGPGHSCFIVAEMSANARTLAEAKEIVLWAKLAGADAVKTQCFAAETMTIDSDTEQFMIDWQGQMRTLYSLYREAAMPLCWHADLKKLTESLGMIYFASVFSRADVDFMRSLDVACYKISSFELGDTGLIRYAASKGKPIILSTGMGTIGEINAAIRAANDGKKDRVHLPENRHLMPPCEVALLKCTSAYPASATDANLRTIQQMRECQFPHIPIGLSDHTLGIAVPVAAVALGACIIEKHLCLDRSLGGPDAAFSLEPHEFKAMVEAVRIAEQALGEVRYGPTESEKPMLRYRRSLFVVDDVQAGELFTAENVRSIRPADGLHPKHYDEVLGKRAARNIERATPLTWEMIAQEA